MPGSFQAARAMFPFRKRSASPFRPQLMPTGMPSFPALCQTRFVLMHQALEPRRSRSRVPGCPIPELPTPKWPLACSSPELREAGNHPTRSGRGDLATANVLAALALIDPQQAVERVLALPDDTGARTDPMTTKNWARIQVAKVLAVHGADRWRHVCARLLSLGTPDQKDL